MFGAGKKIAQRNYAGLAIHDDFIHFAEINEEGEESRTASAALPEGCVINGAIKDFAMLEEAFKAIRRKIGKIREPVTIGLPYADTIIRRPVQMPKMSIEDIRSTMELNFEDYFTTRVDTVFDAVIIKTPADNDKEKVSVLAATAKESLVNKILEIAKKAEIPAGAIEPVNFAMLRSVKSSEGLCIFADKHNTIALWEGYGIFFRTSNSINGFQDILNTVQFLRTQYRHAELNQIILAELDFQISTDSGLSIVSIDDPFYSAKGLALRDSPEEGLDLRPPEYVELERRRYSFNPNRLILWGLLGAFLMMTAGVVSYAFLNIHKLSGMIDDMNEHVSRLTIQRQALERKNAELETATRQTQKILDFLKGDIPVLEILNALEQNQAAGIKFDNADFSTATFGGYRVVLDGKAADESAVITMISGLKQNDIFSNVVLPFSQKDQLQRIVFKLILSVKDILVLRAGDSAHGK